MKRLVPVEFVGAIIACSMFVILIGLVDIDIADRPDPDLSANSDPVPDQTTADATGLPDCDRMKAEFSAKLEQSRSCTVDADCALATFGCPFGCTTSVQMSVVDELKREERAFQDACHYCTYICQVPFLEWRPACVRQRCIVLEQSVDDLEQETLQFLNESG